MKLTCNYKPVYEVAKQQPITNHTQTQKKLNGSLTIIDQSSILEKILQEENEGSVFSQIQIQSINQQNHIRMGKIQRKKHAKLIQIMAIKQRRSEFRDIQNTQTMSIEIISKVYDWKTSDFEKMCKYYALTQNDSNQSSSPLANSPVICISAVKKDKQTQQKEKIHDYSKQNLKNREDYGLCKKLQNSNEDQSDSFFLSHSRNTFTNQSTLESLQLRNQNIKDLNNKMGERIRNSQNERTQQQMTEIQRNFNVNNTSIIKNPSNNIIIKNPDLIKFNQGCSKYSIQQSIDTLQKFPHQPISQKFLSQSQQNNILYDSSILISQNSQKQYNYEKNNNLLQNMKQDIIFDIAQEEEIYQNEINIIKPLQIPLLKQEKKEENKIDCSKFNSRTISQKQRDSLNVQDCKTASNNITVTRSGINQQNSQNQFKKFEDVEKEGFRDDKIEIFQQQLQLLIANPSEQRQNSLGNNISILQKCIYLTQASYTHSIMSNLLNDFSQLSETKELVNESQQISCSNEDEQEDQTAAALKQKITNNQRLHCRASTNYSGSSITTQPMLTKPSSIPSISNEIISASALGAKNEKYGIIEGSNTMSEVNNKNQLKQNQLQNQQVLQQSFSQFLSEKNQDNEQIQKQEIRQNIPTLSQAKQNFQSNCMKFFQLKNLTQKQLHQFKFSQYKKKSNSSLSLLGAGCSPKNSINLNNSNLQATQTECGGNVSKFGKFHNYNKLFMYNILNMFQPNNLDSMNVPEVISKELQMLISRIKASAKNNYKVEGKYAFDYFSHAHYNVLFLQLTPENIQDLLQQEEYINLYKTCFNLDLTAKISDITMTYINLIKMYCYKIFIQCIREEDIVVDSSLCQENLKNQYTLKVIKGIKKLSEGLIIKRF